MKKLILVGGGGHCKSVIDVAEKADYSIVGILDLAENVGKSILGYKVIGTDDDIPKYVNDALFLVTVGQIKNSSLRIKIHREIEKAGGVLATVISPTAQISKYASLGEGTVVMHKAVINVDTKIGRGCIINTFSNIEHDVSIGNYTHISTGAMINGDCRIGNSVFIGSQSVVSNGIFIVDESIVSAGAFVNKNIEIPGIYLGNPIQKIK
ncbi:MAG: acetyltransferase [Bacteroidales bacterium]|nr:acetyltransferase [Bacteroidales bacterium]